MDRGCNLSESSTTPPKTLLVLKREGSEGEGSLYMRTLYEQCQCRKVQSSTLSFMSPILPLFSVSSFLVLVRHSNLLFEVNQLGITTMGVKDLVATRKSAHIEDSAHIFFGGIQLRATSRIIGFGRDYVRNSRSRAFI